MDTDRLIIADRVDLRTKHHSCESEEEDGFETEEDQQQHRHSWGEVTAFWSQKTERKVKFYLFSLLSSKTDISSLKEPKSQN